eukprot:347870-Chlamydomonas_euryale.AAC.2
MKCHYNHPNSDHPRPAGQLVQIRARARTPCSPWPWAAIPSGWPWQNGRGKRKGILLAHRPPQFLLDTLASLPSLLPWRWSIWHLLRSHRLSRLATCALIGRAYAWVHARLRRPRASPLTDTSVHA